MTELDTAARYGSDFPEAASTPFVLGLSELACHDVLADHLGDGQVTVGLGAEIQHTAPTPVGATVTATATEVERQGNKVSFVVEVRDPAGVCATVTHRRAIVDRAAIVARLESRLSEKDGSDG